MCLNLVGIETKSARDSLNRMEANFRHNTTDELLARQATFHRSHKPTKYKNCHSFTGNCAGIENPKIAELNNNGTSTGLRSTPKT